MNKLFKKVWKRGMAMVLVLAMVITLLPSYSVSAVETVVAEASEFVVDKDPSTSLGNKLEYSSGKRAMLYLPAEYKPVVGDVITIKATTTETANIVVQPGRGSYYNENPENARYLSANNSTIVYTVDQNWIDNVLQKKEGAVFFRFKFDGTTGNSLEATVTVTRDVPEMIKVDVPFTLSAESGALKPVEDVWGCLKTETGGGTLRGALEFPEGFEVEQDKLLIVNYETNMSSIAVEYGYGSSSESGMSSYYDKMTSSSNTLVIRLTSDHVAFFENANTNGKIARLRLKADSSKPGDYVKIISVRYGDIEGEVPIAYPTVEKGIAGSHGGSIQSIGEQYPDDVVALTYVPDGGLPYFHINIEGHNVTKYNRMKIVLTPSRDGMKLSIGGIKTGWDAFSGWNNVIMLADERQEFIIDLPQDMDFVRFWLDDGYQSEETLTFRVHSIEFMDSNATSDESYAVSLKSQDTEGNTSIANLSMNVTTPVAAGTSVTAKATDLLNYTFVGWFDSATGNELTKNFAYTFNISEDTNLVAKYEKKANSMATITIEGTDYEVQGATQVGETNQFTASIGSKVVVTANNTDGKFINWCNANDKIVTTESSYKFTVTGDETLKMSQKGTAGETARVEFLSDYNQIISVGTYAADSDIELPEGPSKIGYTFKSWDHTLEQIKEKISSSAHIIVKPVYESISQPCVVEVFVDGKKNTDLSKNYNLGDKLSITAPNVFNKVFQYWTDENDNILGYGKSYLTQISKDVTLKAVYAENALTNAKPVITMSNVFATTDSGVNKVSFSATRNVPTGYTVIEHGMIANRTGFVDPTNDNFVIGADGVTRFKAENRTEVGTYTLNVSVNNDSTSVVARGYMIVSDGIRQEIYYTDVVTRSFSDFNAINE